MQLVDERRVGRGKVELVRLQGQEATGQRVELLVARPQ